MADDNHEVVLGPNAFSLRLQVRDYECDLQGIVNNSVYMNYFEHCRHELLRSLGFDFSRLHEVGIDPVVSRVEIDFKARLRSGDRFDVRLGLRRHGKLRLLFDQRIVVVENGNTAVEAVVHAVFLTRGRPGPPPHEILEALGTFGENSSPGAAE